MSEKAHSDGDSIFTFHEGLDMPLIFGAAALLLVRYDVS